ncbi:sorbosone dehydrogenase family protein [Atribacter sp.]|jgi:glucose/arabinose dehydrogenase|uniref:PQQ-dependent sugar dehydrogenase n=1 Tax=Atribacter sp. TaxID=2847780 RepID=UPI00345E64B9
MNKLMINRIFGILMILGIFAFFSVTLLAADDFSERMVPEPPGIKVERWVENLEIPWSLVFLPNNRALVSERPGRIRLIENGILREEPYAILEVTHIGEGGLMGLALHPNYPEEPYLYAMHTIQGAKGLVNRIILLRDQGNRAVFERVIFDNIPGGRNHNGGRIAFGPDGMLYVTTGETYQGDLAQNLDSWGGKILRFTPDGKVPDDNPFPRSPVYSYGHRNPQGLAWHPETGDLFSSEHGPSGEQGWRGHDEINRIIPGGNYGWPIEIGTHQNPAFIGPIVFWQNSTPPTGMTFFRKDLFVASLRSQALLRIILEIKDGNYQVKEIERWFASGPSAGRFGRLRDVVEGPDGNLYLLTSNRDGRGRPQPGDDAIWRLIFP